MPKVGQPATYSHDDLARITGAHCGTDWDQTFSYDQFGNLTKTGSMSWQPGYNQANNRYTLVGTTYNSKGELTADTFHSYTWGADNAPTAVDGITFTYDPFGRVVEESNAGVNTEYVYMGHQKLASMNGPSVLQGWVPLPGRTVARYSGTNVVKYFVPDVVGSLRIGSTTARVYSGSAYAPFGEQYAVQNSGPALFTGVAQDTVNDEYDFLFRRLHESQGRWISPDPAGFAAFNFEDPQTLNLYAYVMNRPLNLTDPIGLDCAYLNASGSSAESIDHNSNPGECWSNGGFWAEGNIEAASWVITFPSNNNVLIASNVNGFLAQTLAGSFNNGGIAFSQMFTLNASIDTILSNPLTPTNYAANYANPMAPSARQQLLAIANAAPTICGGGAFLYGGFHGEKEPAEGAGMGLIEYDSHSGWQTGTLLEASVGLIGVARIDYTGGGGTEYLLLSGSPVAGTFGSKSSLGVYGGAPTFGGGVYVNITTNAGCKGGS